MAFEMRFAKVVVEERVVLQLRSQELLRIEIQRPLQNRERLLFPEDSRSHEVAGVRPEAFDLLAKDGLARSISRCRATHAVDDNRAQRSASDLRGFSGNSRTAFANERRVARAGQSTTKKMDKENRLPAFSAKYAMRSRIAASTMGFPQKLWGMGCRFRLKSNW